MVCKRPAWPVSAGHRKPEHPTRSHPKSAARETEERNRCSARISHPVFTALRRSGLCKTLALRGGGLSPLSHLRKQRHGRPRLSSARRRPLDLGIARARRDGRHRTEQHVARSASQSETPICRLFVCSDGQGDRARTCDLRFWRPPPWEMDRVMTGSSARLVPAPEVTRHRRPCPSLRTNSDALDDVEACAVAQAIGASGYRGPRHHLGDFHAERHHLDVPH